MTKIQCGCLPDRARKGRVRVLTAESGRHGLRLLEHQEVDLIFVDIFMPEMDGDDRAARYRCARDGDLAAGEA